MPQLINGFTIVYLKNNVLNPDAAWTYIIRGWTKDQLHDTDGSADDYLKAYELDPELTKIVLGGNKDER